VTFAYGHCTTVCPATVQNVDIARRRAGRPGIRLVVLTVDPWRDTPERLPTIAGHWGLAPGDRVLSGDTLVVERALDGLGIGRQRDATTGDVAHATTTMILDGSGRLTWRVDGGWERLERLLAVAR
jgi:cytochrome oxidase Cu insertion factor (SCO1/SenC/PrrC family)